MKPEIYIAQTVKREWGLLCPSCGGGAESATVAGLSKLAAPPEFTRGQLVVCGYCGVFNIYDKPLLRTLTRTERRAELRKLAPEAAKVALEMSARIQAKKRRHEN